MSYRSLRDFLARLEKDGELVRVKEPVSTVLEMTEIQTRLIAEGGPAVLFEKPVRADGAPSDMPVLVNLFGTVKRVAMGVTMGGKERTNARDLREVGELAGPTAPAPAAAQLRRGRGTAAAGQDRAGDEAQDGGQARLPGDRAARAMTSICRNCRSRPAGRASPRR